MKALRVTEPGTIELQEVPTPTPGPGEALLRIHYAGICGSDIQTLKGTQPFASYPRVPGHEFSGEIVEINGDSESLAVGQTVTGVPYFNCGTCYSCQRGIINACHTNQTMGVHRDGAFQQYITMPLDFLHPAGNVSADDLAMVEPFSIGHHAMNRVRITAGENVLVIGAGAIGLLTMVSAAAQGAQVWVADVVDSRLQVASGLGAAGTFNLSTTSIAEAVESATGSNGFDVVAEATGLPVSMLNGIEAAAVGARLALIGNGTREVTFNQSILIKKELDVVGSRNSRHVFDELIEWMDNGTVDISGIRTAVVPLEEGAEALQRAASGAGDDIKILIEF